MGKATGGTTQGQTSQNSTNTVNTGPWSPQQPFIEDVFNKAQAQYQPNAQATYYPGQSVAAFNPAQNAALSDIIGTPDNPNVPAASALNLRTLNGDFLNSNPWVDKTFGMASDAVKRQYMTGTAPQTAGALAAQGRYGSGAYRNLTAGNEINYGKTLDDLATNIYGGNYAHERDIQQQAVGQAPMLASAAYIDPLMRLSAGDRQQQQTQAEYNDSMARYNFNRDQPARALNTYLGQIQGNYGQNGTTTGMSSGTQATPYYSNPAASALGGGLGLASLFSGGGNSAASGISSGLGSLFGKGGGAAGAAGAAGGMGSLASAFGPLIAAGSDIRLKEDIKLIGKTFDGQNLYLFRYKGDPTPHVGLMAQEVEKIMPEAILKRPDGMKAVYYDLALRDSVAIGKAA